MKSRALIGALIAAGILAGIAAYFYWRPGAPPPPPPPVVTAPRTPPVSEVTEPRVRFPVPEAPESKPLPPLAQSDSTALDVLTSLFGRESVSRFFQLDNVIRRFVATVDNLPRKTVAQRIMVVKPAPGSFRVHSEQGEWTISADNNLRYRTYVQLVDAADTKTLVAAYVRLYPLFQAAYQELGYPNGYFNDRLVEAIDDLLAAPEIAAPKLVQPKVMYEFADANLESLSAGRKMMIRLGNANATRVKAKLRAIRREIVEMPR